MIVVLSQDGRRLQHITEVTIKNANEIWVYPGPNRAATYPSVTRCVEVIEEIRQTVTQGIRTYEMKAE